MTYHCIFCVKMERHAEKHYKFYETFFKKRKQFYLGEFKYKETVK